LTYITDSARLIVWMLHFRVKPAQNMGDGLLAVSMAAHSSLRC